MYTDELETTDAPANLISRLTDALERVTAERDRLALLLAER